MNSMLLTSGVLLIVGIGLAVGGVVVIKKSSEYGEWVISGGVMFIIGAFCLLAAILIPVSTYSGRAYGRVECRNWGRQTGRPTKFVVYTSWNSGECLTRGVDGRWISTDNLRQVSR